MEYNDANLLYLDSLSWSHREIAEALGVSRNVVNGRLYRIKKKNPELVIERRMGVHPQGFEVQNAKRRASMEANLAKKNRTAANNEGLAKIKVQFNKAAPKLFAARGRNPDYTKAELREILREAVENTK